MLHLVDDLLDTLGAILCALVPSVAAVALVDHEALVQVFALQGREAVEAVEIGIVILRDDLFYQAFLCFCNRALRAFPYQQYEVFQESRLFHVQLRPVDAERVHRDGVLLRVADVLAAQILAQSFVAVTRIDHYHVRSLFVQLTHD